MAVISREDLLNKLKTRLGDDTSEEAISMVEDFTDTISDYEKRISESGDWKTKYDENDKKWRERYMSRFFGDSESVTDSEVVDAPGAKPVQDLEDEKVTYDDLFKKEVK